MGRFQDQLRGYLSTACTHLKITAPVLELNYVEPGTACYLPTLQTIFMGIDGGVELHEYLKLPFKLNSTRQKWIYLLFHEIGHHWHRTKHTKHYLRFSKDYKSQQRIGICNYSDQKLERIADKIACILFKQLYLGGKRERLTVLSH
jgi:hypothetical protein